MMFHVYLGPLCYGFHTNEINIIHQIGPSNQGVLLDSYHIPGQRQFLECCHLCILKQDSFTITQLPACKHDKVFVVINSHKIVLKKSPDNFPIPVVIKMSRTLSMNLKGFQSYNLLYCGKVSLDGFYHIYLLYYRVNQYHWNEGTMIALPGTHLDLICHALCIQVICHISPNFRFRHYSTATISLPVCIRSKLLQTASNDLQSL